MCRGWECHGGKSTSNSKRERPTKCQPTSTAAVAEITYVIGDVVQIAAACESESEVSKDGSQSLELRVDVVQPASPERTSSWLTSKNLVGILRSKATDILQAVRVCWEVRSNVVDEIIVRRYVRLDQGEQGACANLSQG